MLGDNPRTTFGGVLTLLSHKQATRESNPRFQRRKELVLTTALPKPNTIFFKRPLRVFAYLRVRMALVAFTLTKGFVSFKFTIARTQE